MAKKKPTKAQVELRVLEILRMRLDGARFWDIQEYVREEEIKAGSVWYIGEGAKPMGDSTLWCYISKADKAQRADSLVSRRKLVRRHLEQRRNIHAKAMLAGDLRTALASLDSEAKMLDLFPPTGIKADVKVTSPPAFVEIVVRDGAALPDPDADPAPHRNGSPA